MAAKIKNYMRLLALASPPKPSSTILEWVPFPPGLSIGDLIENHNQNCYKHYRDNNWTDEDIENLACGITVVQDNLTNISELRRKTLEEIDIVMMDLGSVSKLSDELDKFSKKIAARKQPFHISQVANSPKDNSVLSYFKTLPIIPSQPPILRSQSNLESYLDRFVDIYVKIVNVFQQSPPLDYSSRIPSAIFKDFMLTSPQRKDLPKLASELRDVALMKNLSEKQIGDLAQVAVAQEHLLTNLSGQIELKSGVQVGKTAFNVVRKPIIQLHAQEYKVFPKIKNAKFLYLSKLDDASKLTYEEKKTLGDLGIKKDQTAVVQFDTTAIRSLMGKVGDKLKVTEFKGKIFD